MANIGMLVGRTIATITNDDDEILHITCDDGSRFRMLHHQSCCEHVYINDIEGDLQSLVGNPILLAEEREYDGGKMAEYDDSYTWTFYTLATIKGHVDIRWYGSSNGYYSESVDFEYLNTDKPRSSYAYGRTEIGKAGWGVWE